MSTSTSLEGSLDLFQLPEILQVVAQQQKTGILTVQGDDDIFAISFSHGDVVAADSLNQAGDEALFALLERDQMLPQADLEAVREIVENDGERLIDVLEGKEYLERSEILGALRNQYLDLLGTLLTWTSGDFKFYSNNEVAYEDGLRPIRVQDVLLNSIPLESDEPAESSSTPLPPIAPLSDASPAAASAPLAVSPSADVFAEAGTQGLPGLDDSLLSLDESLLATTTSLDVDSETDAAVDAAFDGVQVAGPSPRSAPSPPVAGQGSGAGQGKAPSAAEAPVLPLASAPAPPLPSKGPLGWVLRRLPSNKPLEVRAGEPTGVRGEVLVISPAQQQVLSRIDGQRTLGDIGADCGLADAEALALLSQLEELRLVKAAEATIEPPLMTLFEDSPLGGLTEDLEETAPQTNWAPMYAWGFRALTVVAAIALALVSVRTPTALIVPLPWQGDVRSEIHGLQRQAAYLEIDRAAKTHYLVQGAFPEALNDLVDEHLLSPSATVEPAGRPLSYLPDDVTYGIAPVDNGQLLEALATTEGVAGNFLLDLDFYSLRVQERSKPLVLLD